MIWLVFVHADLILPVLFHGFDNCIYFVIQILGISMIIQLNVHKGQHANCRDTRLLKVFLLVLWPKDSNPCHGPLVRYVKLRVAHAPGMQGTFSPPPRVSDPDMHHGTCVTHMPWCMPGSLTGGFLWSWWRGKRSRHSRRMRNPQFYVSGKRPIVTIVVWQCDNFILHY